MGTYTLFKHEGKEVGGMMKKPAQAEGPSAWLLYVAVQDVDATAQKIGDLGGCLFVPPSDIPDVGRFAVAADPNGAAFAIFKSVKW